MTGTPSAAPTLGTKLAYGFGAAANGVADNAFSYFLLMFYGQVIGLSPILVGLAMTIGLMIDACLTRSLAFGQTICARLGGVVIPSSMPRWCRQACYFS